MFGGNISKSAGCRSMCCSILYLLLGLRPLQGVTLKTWHAVNSRNSFNMPANDKATTPKCPHEADVARYYGSGRWANDWPVYIRRRHNPAGEVLHCAKCGKIWLNPF